MEEQYIEIKGARVNNLKNVSLKIPRDQWITITGVSGSGKSSLAFDTLYAEGQRRYVESLSSYARQFLGRMSKPECDFINGLPPAIAIEQRVTSRNPRSTVGTSTEIYEYLRLLFARVGHTISPISGQEVRRHTPEDVVTHVQTLGQGTRFMVLAPMRLPEGRSMAGQLQMYLQEGYTRMMLHHDVMRIEELLERDDVDRLSPDEMMLVVDRLAVSDDRDTISRLTDSVETAFFEGQGACRIWVVPSGLTYDFSSRFEADGLTFETPSDNLFSFNSPVGACDYCDGFGSAIGIDERLVIPDPSLSVHQGCVQCWQGPHMSEWRRDFEVLAVKDNFPIFTPYEELTREQRNQLWHGLPSDLKEHRNKAEDCTCIDGFFHMVELNQYKIQYRVLKSRYRGRTICPKCHGSRLKKEALWVKVDGFSIADLVEMPIHELRNWAERLQLPNAEAKVAQRLLTEIQSRLGFLCDVGLGYLKLNRPSNTLSGGESQRVSLSTSLGSALVGSLYILDEPSIGLHSRDTERLIHVLRGLQQLGNTVMVVEHDEEIMRAADWLIDVGPDAGTKGGEIVYHGAMPTALKEGTFTGEQAKQWMAENPLSHTLRYLTGAEQITPPTTRRKWTSCIHLTGCRMNNLKGVNVQIPLHAFTVVTGVSGSGKSSLVRGTLYPALKRLLGEVCDAPGDFQSIIGYSKNLSKVEFVDQNPIGTSTRSNPATYTKAYDAIRQLMADQPLAKQEGITAQYFSFNTEGGRCEECKGAGEITVEMQFMSDLVLECESCHGKRFKKEVLEVTYHGKNIYDILTMTVDDAIAFFKEHKARTVVKRLKPLQDVGLGYIQLGQSSSTLSGGENQRVKLASFMQMEQSESTLFIFDEPTTGLHFHDISRLLQAFQALIDRGHTVLVVEHNLDVVKMADWVIDLGPEGGDRGGQLVVAGTPETVAACEDSITGKYLKEKLS